MSAFVCSDAHIKTLAVFAARGDRYTRKWDQVQEFADVLYRQNVRSVDHRYNDKTGLTLHPGPRVTPQEAMFFAIPDPVVILKLANCYSYQACETEDYDSTEAAKIIASVTQAAIRLLPGYNEAPWGISDLSDLRPAVSA